MPQHSLRRTSVRASSPHGARRPEDGVAERIELQRRRETAVGVSQPGLGCQQVQQGHDEVDQMLG